jgi:hypothetical protein
MDYQHMIDQLSNFDLDWNNDLDMVRRGKHYNDDHSRRALVRIADEMRHVAVALTKLAEV